MPFIYGLFDTENPERIRYVGQTRSPRGVGHRVYMHKWSAQNTPYEYPVARWIRKIGVDRVDYVVLRDVPARDLNRFETESIAEYRARGQADLNILPGGQGFSTEAVSGEKNHRATLDWSSVRELRERAQKEYVSTPEESKRLGITVSAVGKILRNYTWVDPDYDPKLRVTIADQNKGSEGLVWRRHSDAEVESIRALYLSGSSQTDLCTRFKTAPSTMNRLLFWSYGSAESREGCIEERLRRRVR